MTQLGRRARFRCVLLRVRIPLPAPISTPSVGGTPNGKYHLIFFGLTTPAATWWCRWAIVSNHWVQALIAAYLVVAWTLNILDILFPEDEEDMVP